MTEKAILLVNLSDWAIVDTFPQFMSRYQWINIQTCLWNEHESSAQCIIYLISLTHVPRFIFFPDQPALVWELISLQIWLKGILLFITTEKAEGLSVITSYENIFTSNTMAHIQVKIVHQNTSRIPIPINCNHWQWDNQDNLLSESTMKWKTSCGTFKI